MAKDAITMFKEAAVQLQKEMEYQALRSACDANDNNEALQKLIGDFNLARLDLNAELSKEDDKDQEKIAALNAQVNTLYNEVMATESMKTYNEAKTEMENVMSYINAILNTAVNGGDPMTTEMPQQGCSGSCSSCAGCH